MNINMVWVLSVIIRVAVSKIFFITTSIIVHNNYDHDHIIRLSNANVAGDHNNFDYLSDMAGDNNSLYQIIHLTWLETIIHYHR